MKVMKIQRNVTDNRNAIDGEPVENVLKFTYLGAIFTISNKDSNEIERRIGIAENAAVALATNSGKIKT